MNDGSSTEKPIPYSERRYPTRQDMRVEIARLNGLVNLYKPAGPVPLVMYCPAGHPHVDEGEWATRSHKTHECQYWVEKKVGPGQERCGRTWKPAEFPTVGVAEKDH